MAIENSLSPFLENISARFSTEIFQKGEQAFCFVPAENIREVLQEIKNRGFDMLVDVTATDSLKEKEVSARFTVIYQLMNTGNFSRLRLKSRVAENERHPSVSDIFPAANFAEREVFDMFGIVFDGHPKMERFLCPDDFEGYPLRKDFPLKGKGYRDRYPNYQKDLLERDA
jgi:NADH-quinone oxidoreductase subunit C